MSAVILTSSSPAAMASFNGRTGFRTRMPVLMRAIFSSRTTFQTAMTGGHGLAYFRGRTEFRAVLSVQREMSATFSGRTSFYSSLELPNYPPFSFSFVADILPANSTVNVLWLPRLRVDGVEIPVRSGTYSEQPNTSGGQLQVVLARLGDKALMTPTAVIDFGFGRKEAGDWVEADFVFKLQNGSVMGTTHSIGANGTEWTDTFTVQTKSSMQNMLDKSPDRDLVMYDSSVQTITLADFETLYDNLGNDYVTELEPRSSLTLYDLFEEVFINRIGFTGYETNIPNFHLTRVDMPIGQTYVQSIGGFFGMFEPVIYTYADKVWIIDATLALPEGFPAPLQRTVTNYSGLTVNETRRNIDAYEVNYVENGRGFDFVTIRTETSEHEQGDISDGSYTLTTIERGFRQYRKFSNPTVIIKEELYKEYRDTENADSELINRVRESRLFNELGQMYRRDLDKWDRMPDVENDGTLTLMKTAEERETWSYAAHPFQRRMQYLQKHELNTSGLQIVDSANQQLGQDFVQEYSVALRSGNLVDGQTTQFTKLWTKAETYLPLRGGMVRVQEYEVYHPTSSMPKSGSPRDVPGDVAISAVSPQRKRILVLADDITTITGKRVDKVSAGELPVEYIIPLFRRKLKRAQTRGREGDVELVGHDIAIRRGIALTLLGRTPSESTTEVIGNFLVLGISMPFSASGVSTSINVRELDESDAYVIGPSFPVGSYTFQILSSGVYTLTLNIACEADYTLASTAVSDLLIEARPTGIGSFVNIETTPIDLTPYADTTQEFEVRITAGTVTTPASRSFTLEVEHP